MAKGVAVEGDDEERESREERVRADDRRRRRGNPIARVLRPKIRKCLNEHEGAIDGNPQVSVSFEIGGDGYPLSPRLSSKELARLPVGDCIVQAVAMSRIDKRYAGSRMTVPFRIVKR